jgi:hypothetical protein
LVDLMGDKKVGSGVNDKGCFGWAEEDGGRTDAGRAASRSNRAVN